MRDLQFVSVIIAFRFKRKFIVRYKRYFIGIIACRKRTYAVYRLVHRIIFYRKIQPFVLAAAVALFHVFFVIIGDFEGYRRLRAAFAVNGNGILRDQR